MSISLIHANRYVGEGGASIPFFGSVNFRGSQRSALAYLPLEPFWRLPSLIERGAEIIRIEFSPMRHGFGELLNLWIGMKGDLDAIGA